ncbi:MAG: DUF362 domain-containing protein [Deltaproteobacteria bacterium]|nr:DUF362 domain-containing protein [Deltaproteobacteria bacterium]
MYNVALLHCSEYEHELLKDRVRRALSLIGFDPARFSGKRVGLKPNLLMPFAPDRAVVTHPEFFRAAAAVVKENNGVPVLTECPNFLSQQATVDKVGYGGILAELGVDMADMDETASLPSAGGELYKKIDVSKAVLEVDILLNLAKMKTHAFTYLSGPVKHLFGVIPGIRKSRMHMRLPDNERFSTFLLDLYAGLCAHFAPPRAMIHLVDGVLAMEGNGPGPSGTPKRMNAVLAGENALAVERVIVAITGLDPNKLYTLMKGAARGMGPGSLEDVEVLGDKVEDLYSPDFAPPSRTLYGGVAWPLTSPTLKNWFVERPVPDPEKCALCYHCKRTCPADAISPAKKGGKVPRFDYKACIRCFCCMEICPEAAITIRKGRLQWMLKV